MRKINRERLKKNFIEKTKLVHGDLFDYSLVEYKNSKTKIKIICKKHGVFEKTPYSHIAGVGCPVCSGPKYRGFLKNAEDTRLTKKVFLERSISKHGEKYDYSLVKYEKQQTKVKIICPEHGAFFQFPDNHMRGHGCQKCHLEKAQIFLVEAGKKISKKVRSCYIDRVKKIHGNKYDYSETKYTTWDCKIKIICPIHGQFYQGANNHKQGEGCPQCAPTGFNGEIPAILYYIEILSCNGEPPIYKIGITNRTIEQRYQLLRDRDKINVLKTWEYPLGRDARKAERKIVMAHKEKKYNGEPPLVYVGTAEMFCEDVLQLADKGGN